MVTIKMTMAQVKAYVRKHGTWDGLIVPSKMYPGANFSQRIHLSLSNGQIVDSSTMQPFDTMYSAWSYYNTSYELGYYAHFYRIDK